MKNKQREEWIEEKAQELFKLLNLGYLNEDSRPRDFIRTIVKEIEDKHWATEQYHLDTIKELKKQLDERKPKVDMEFVKEQSAFLVKRINDECRFSLTYLQKIGALHTLSEKGDLIDVLYKAGVEVED